MKNTLDNLTLLPILDTLYLIERIFLVPTNKSRQCFRARIIKAIVNQEDKYTKESFRLKFIYSIKDD